MDTLTFHLGSGTPEETRQQLELFLNALGHANAIYYRTFPKGPCCPKCAGLMYRAPCNPDQPGEVFLGVEPLYVEGAGACGSLAAMVMGHELAHGRDARVVVELTSSPTSPHRDYHATVLVDGERRDPAQSLIDADRVDAACNCPGVSA